MPNDDNALIPIIRDDGSFVTQVLAALARSSASTVERGWTWPRKTTRAAAAASPPSLEEEEGAEVGDRGGWDGADAAKYLAQVLATLITRGQNIGF